MRVLVAGASGAVGCPLVRMLREGGHEVLGTTRSEAKVDLLRGLGAEPLVCDARDGEALGRVVLEAEPEAIVNQLTDLSALECPRFDGHLSAGSVGAWLEDVRHGESSGSAAVSAGVQA